MPRIDPQRLLKCLNPLLDSNGAIKSDKEVDKIYGLMSKFSKKLVSKCMYLNIMKATPEEVLDLFMQRGGWEMIYGWTAEANENKNYALLTEIGNLLLKTPATTNRLKENELPKIIKNLSRESEREETKAVAKQVFIKWMSIAKNENSPAGENSKTGVPGMVEESGIETVVVNPNAPDVQHVVLLDTEYPQNEFDVNQYIGSADLNELVFNPDIFNNTVDQHLTDSHINSTINDQSHLNTKIFAADSTSSLGNDAIQFELAEVGPNFIQQTQRVVVGTSTGDQNLTPQKSASTPYALIMRDGKHYLMKIQDSSSGTTEEGKAKKGDQADGSERKRPRKDPTVKQPHIAFSGGKPSMKTYGLKVKSAEITASEQAALLRKQKAEKSKKTVSDEPNKKKDVSQKPSSSDPKAIRNSGDVKKGAASADSKKTSSKAKAKSAAAEAAKREEEEKFRKKMAEQKKLLDLRKKEAEKEKIQKEKDEATLKALKLSGGTNARIPKIPKKAPTFADMIGIPGVKDDSKVATGEKKLKKRNSLEGSTASDPATSTTEKEKSGNKEETKERKHRPKVYNHAKSRSLSLLEDMELTIKEKEKKPSTEDLEKRMKEADEILALDSDKPARISKAVKRPSTDSLAKPGDSKKSRSTEEKEKKDAKKKEKSKEKEQNNSKKIVGIQESSLFMDAITASASAAAGKNVKRKRRTSSTADSAKDLEAKDKTSRGKVKVESPTEESAPAKPSFNFYRDTLADDENEKPNQKVESPDDAKPSTDEQPVEEKDAFEPEEGEGVLKSALILHRSKNKTKKSVSWKDDEVLKQFYFFEMDETERVNVSRQVRNFTEMKQIERSEERKQVRRNFSTVDNMEEKTAWVKPLKILDLNVPFVPNKSMEKTIQEERETGILEVFYFSKSQIPESADEALITPNFNLTPPKLIPFENENDSQSSGSCGSQDPPIDNPFQNEISGKSGAQSAGIGFDTSNSNGFGFNVPPPGYNTVSDQASFNGWNTVNPFTAPPAAADVWNVPTDSFQNFANPNMMPGMGQPPFHNSQFDFAPFHVRGGSHGRMRLPLPGNPFHGHPRGFGPPRGRGFPGRDRGDPNRDMDKDYHGRSRDRDRERDRDDRRRDKDRYDHDRDRDRGRDRERGGRGDHGEARESRRRAGRPPTVPCKFFAIGKCKLGDSCDFLHGPPKPPKKSISPPLPRQMEIDQDLENWDAPLPQKSIDTSEMNGKGSDEMEASFTQAPESPDCVPPGTETEPLMVIPVQ